MEVEKTEYSQLQQGVDKLIGKFGVSKARNIIEQLSSPVKKRTNVKQQSQLITAFIISEASIVFQVDLLQKEVRSKAYRDARMASYHLLNNYTELSYAEIGKLFNQGRYGVYYHNKNCTELLSIPQFHKRFVTNYQTLETKLLQFIAQINETT